MKKAVHIILIICVAGIAIFLWRTFRGPVAFEKERVAREAVVIAHLKEIRTAQDAHLQKYGEYAGNIDALIDFILADSVAAGGDKSETPPQMVAVRSLVRSGRLSDRQIDSLRYIPYAGYQPFYMEAGLVDTYGGQSAPVFECRAPYKAFLSGLDHQQLINLIDSFKSRGEYPGLMIGSMEKPFYNGGNWE